MYRSLGVTESNERDVELLLKLLSRNTRLKFQNLPVSATTPTVRFSGECNTSLGNSINNLLCIQSALRHQGADSEAVIVEGDDSIVRIPNDFDVDLFRKDLESFGLAVKCDECYGLNSTGFCQLYWAPDHTLCVDFRNRIRKFIWSTRKSDTAEQLAQRA